MNVYERALEIYNDHGGGTTLVGMRADGTYEVCLVGAVAEAARVSPREMDDPLSLVGEDVYRLLELEPLLLLAREMFPEQRGRLDEPADVTIINDELGRDAVIQLLEKAVAKLEEEILA